MRIWPPPGSPGLRGMVADIRLDMSLNPSFMACTVLFDNAFDAEFKAWVEGLRDELLAHAKLLAEFGPDLGRPSVNTLKGSRHANMKELRFSWSGQV